ncbi:RagB/SusD family nutrient uptake outer membrane protein [Wocania ichthyoenteri]|uniref:RagB/SusD family nutrient uptake outer membrane protein n=1 Tax=Wocania ichthyoenteri TaxID=1230531 RepID=UPI0009DF0420|nr:RagB/SusD family nutrient uptake outer membrane protein [Wocania ichthyoenteri]
MKILKFNNILYMSFILMFISCADEMDAVKNLNNPDTKLVLAVGSDLNAVVGGGYTTWWQANNRDTYAALAVAADHGTASWGNYGMRSLSWEPRNPLLNAASWADVNVVEQPWQGNYAAISSANDVLGAINNDGIEWIEGGVDRTPQVKASSHFLRGLGYGYLGLLFEKGFIVDENTDLSQKLPFVPYNELIAQAITDLDACIALASSNDFTITDNFINGITPTSAELIKICNSFKARFIVQSARFIDETNAIDWNTIKTLTQNGITEDFGPTGDNGVIWWSNVFVFSESPNGFGTFGGRLDMRVVNLLDPSQPEFYPATAGAVLANPEMTTPDARVGIGKDFEFRANIVFFPARGQFHFSHYISMRYANDDNFSDGADSKQLKSFMLEDNRLLLAEAQARLDELGDAVATVNESSRVTRGNLTPLAGGASKTEIMDAIFYERYVELFNSACGSGFFDRRRTNQLQVGTFRHFPVPATELQVIEEELYTFGGVTVDPTGVMPHFDISAAAARTDDTNIPTFN